MSEEQTYNIPLSEQIESALEHYEDLATKGHHWNSLVVAAIKSYNPSKDQQIKELTELLGKAEGAIIASEEGSAATFNEWKKYFTTHLELYKQKYPKP